MLWHGLVILILITVVWGLQKGSKYPAKGFYCKDPDTGKLHPVNSTWTSSTFCGSYTCRIKKKNVDGNQVSLELSTNKTETETDNKNKVGKRTHDDTVAKGDLGNGTSQSLLGATKNLSNNTKQVDLFVNDVSYKDDEIEAENIEGDRLLTDKEVKALTILLKTIKLSELDAILQVFHLAHDLYAEVDKVIEGVENNEEKRSDITGLKSEETNKEGDIVSYWYEPLTIMNSKVKADAKIFINKANDKETKTLASEMPTKETYLKKGIVSLKLNPIKLENKELFTKTLTTDTVKQAAYYHPMTDFQRQSSYTHTPQQPNSYRQTSVLLPQIAKLIDRPVIPLPNIAFPASYTEHKKPDKCGKNGEVTLLTKKLNVLPWLANKGDVSYNLKRAEVLSLPRNSARGSLGIPLEYIAAIAKGANPLSFLTFAKTGKHIHHVPVVATDVARNPSNIILDEEINAAPRVTDAGPLLDPVRSSMENLLPAWSTGVVGVPVFNDVKSPEEAIYSGNLLPFPFKKNAKIKRLPYAGENKRKKRDEELNRDEFELYLEKSTCETDVEPGFFRMGDSTKPFPACCPQRIQRNVQNKTYLHT